MCGGFGGGGVGGDHVTGEDRAIGSVNGGDRTADSGGGAGFGLTFAGDTWAVADGGTVSVGSAGGAALGIGTVDDDVNGKDGAGGTSDRRSLRHDNKT